MTERIGEAGVKNVGNSVTRERGGKAINEIHLDTPQLEPINMGITSSSKQETSETP